MIEKTGAMIEKTREFNAMQSVKRRFFAMRNGAIARQMKERGANYRINFGLNLPQITEIARDFLPGGAESAVLEGADYAAFARSLRDNVSTRESMLIAPMLFPVEALSFDEALAWARSVPTPEVADILCMKLLRRHPDAPRLVTALLPLASTNCPDISDISAGSDGSGISDISDRSDGSDNSDTTPLAAYTALRLLLNLSIIGRTSADLIAHIHSSFPVTSSTHPLLLPILRQLGEARP